MISLREIGAPFLAVAAPFMLTANPGAALAEECKQAPAAAPAQSSLLSNPSQRRAAGVASRDWNLINLSSPPVLVADASRAVAQAQPNCPPPDDAVTIVQRQNQRIIDAKRALRETLRNRSPIPGS
jgi:hypothetical protein